jgi:hypothetical protein
MITLAQIRYQNQFLLVVAENAATAQMLELAASLGITREIQVVDGGNHFNVYRLAKFIRRRTAQLDKTLQQIKIARCFNCYQTVSQICENILPELPVLILDLLYTFYDEDISLKESQRLLERVLEAIRKISCNQPVIASVRPPWKNPERICLLQTLKEAAEVCWELDGTDRPALPQQSGWIPESFWD